MCSHPEVRSTAVSDRGLTLMIQIHTGKDDWKKMECATGEDFIQVVSCVHNQVLRLGTFSGEWRSSRSTILTTQAAFRPLLQGEKKMMWNPSGNQSWQKGRQFQVFFLAQCQTHTLISFLKLKAKASVYMWEMCRVCNLRLKGTKQCTGHRQRFMYVSNVALINLNEPRSGCEQTSWAGESQQTHGHTIIVFSVLFKCHTNLST